MQTNKTTGIVAIEASNIVFKNGQTLQNLFDSGKLVTTKTVIQKETIETGTSVNYDALQQELAQLNNKVEKEYERINIYFHDKEEAHQKAINQSSGYFASNLRDVKAQMETMNKEFYEENVKNVKNLLEKHKEEITLMFDNVKQQIKEVENKIDAATEMTREDLTKAQEDLHKEIDRELEYVKEYLIFLEEEIGLNNELHEIQETVVQKKKPAEQIERVVDVIKEKIAAIEEPEVQPEEEFFEEDMTPKKALYRFVSTYEDPIEDENGVEMIDVDLTFSTNNKYRTSYKYVLQDGVIQRIKYQITK